jgi:hypothetical protein
MLTDTKVRQTKPGTKPIFLFDGGGLYVQVTPTGGKWWRFKYRYAGKQKLLSFGVYPDVGVREARERHAQARKLLAQGIDPSEQRKTDKKQEREGRGNTFAALAEA